ncbi:MAG: peptidoglycan DD-metalloendopeptidase family protein [Candidatus Harrisonbacteria bacterium]|nr:peptidoglycan DD-metalloendopeptidase family protein [Candidatus Harrisonbacteria bacterium]
MTVVFIAAMSVFNVLFLAYLNQSGGSPKDFLSRSLDFWGADFLQEVSIYSGFASAEGIGSVDIGFAPEGRETRFIIVDSAALLNTNNPISNVVPTREGLMIYKVQKGDNLSKIAANFGISLNTILWANENLKSQLLQAGQEIVILPVTGVLHRVQDEETLESISNQYNVPIERILNANPTLIPAKLSAGFTIIIPDTRPMRSSRLAGVSSLPSIPGYFSIPTTGWNWGQLHNNNAVDIANACGTPIYAAAEGLVVEAASGWNDGYGNYILIEHPNNTQTKYAHNSKNLVAVGDYVVKGDSIAIIGNTGLTHGPTGCHLHFEVKGARNPFVK